MADRYGRKKATLLAGLFIIAGSLFSMMPKTFNELLFFRFLVGIGLGITSMVVPVYLAEMAANEHRGKMVSIFQISVTIGIFVSYIVNLCLIGSRDWRLALGLAALFASLGTLILFFVPESTSWSLAKNAPKITLRQLFGKGLRKALSIGVLLSVFQQVTGINAVVFFAPEMFHNAGITCIYGKLALTACLGILNVGTAIFAMLQIDRWGRRKLLLMGIPGMVVSLLFIGAVHSNPWLSLGGIIAYILCFGISLGPVVWVMTAEIFPLDIRGKAVSISLFMNWFATLAVAGSYFFLVRLLGAGGPFFVFAGMSLLAFFFVYFFVPETKGKSLEEIQQSWYS